MSVVGVDILSLNLHGHHPTGETPRWHEDSIGRLRAADSNLFYFTAEELDRGSRRRLDRLADAIHRLGPDLILLQEVAAGCPWAARDEAMFHRSFPDDWFEANSALRLTSRLNRLAGEAGWSAHLVCRGNVGWHTHAGTFTRERIVTFDDGGRRRIVHDFNANPYPAGILVEGFALLARQPWRVANQERRDLTHNRLGHKVTVQAAIVERGAGGPWLAAVNVHLGHKLAHFEQALAVRRLAAELGRQANLPGPCLGVVVGGDFNAGLYRPLPHGVAAEDPSRHAPVGRPIGPAGGEASMAPWEYACPGRWDWRRPSRRGEVLAALWSLHDDRGYKPWATPPDATAAGRITDAVDSFFALAGELPDEALRWQDAVETAGSTAVAARTGLPVAASLTGRIDYLLTAPSLRAVEAAVLWPEHDWHRTDGLSDHPGLWARYEAMA
jgi:endonuclease/exonuclease/phosphatase family metal-dependent hydrolase